jgi:hypothetical protein
VIPHLRRAMARLEELETQREGDRVPRSSRDEAPLG